MQLTGLSAPMYSEYDGFGYADQKRTTIYRNPAHDVPLPDQESSP